MFLFSAKAFGQIVFLHQPYDYGVISKANQYVDIPIKNTSDKKVFIFRADVDRRFKVHYSSNTILPDSTVYMRVLFTPTKKGYFKEEIPIHFSCYDEPKSVQITGVAEELPSTAIACPNFSQEAPLEATHFKFTVKVVDKQTQAPIEKASVRMINNGLVAQQLLTNRDGVSSQKVDLGLYYFVTQKEGYESVEFPKYINKSNNYVLIEMERRENDLVVEQEPETTEDISEPTPQIEDELEPSDTVELVEEVILEEETPLVPEPTSTEEKYPNFPLSKYKPNNIVFLIDVSTSMRFTGKLDLLKASMIEMTKLLRDVDNITIVTYASKTQVAMETMSAENKDSIISKIESLQARGMTAGGKGLKLAYSKACESFIAGGNNEIIMATDGDFNSGSENVYKLAKNYKEKGVKVSVIGIKNRREHERNMRKLATYGGGDYIKIDNFDDALNNLVEEIKKSSLM